MMLSLSRREGESVMIGDDVKVTVHRIDGRNVRLSFSAPRNVRVDREEVYHARKHSTDS